MSKSIMLSIKPRFVAKILNQEKTIEIRKTMPKTDLPIDVYIYCTKDSKQRLYPVALLDKSNQVFKRAYREDKIDNRTNYLNGKIVAKFTLYSISQLKVIHDDIYDNMVCPGVCITHKELEDYLRNKLGYAWHISNLVIFDKPKELSEFGVKSSPQSYQYIEIGE